MKCSLRTIIMALLGSVSSEKSCLSSINKNTGQPPITVNLSTNNSAQFTFILSHVKGWMYFVPLKDITLANRIANPTHKHSEYIFGDCSRRDIKFYSTVHLDNMDVLGKVIIRGWLPIRRIPTCIKIRATSYEEDLFRSTAYNFQMCVPRVSYCHTQKRISFYYYEWYIPEDMSGGMNWDLYFFGPIRMSW